MMKGNGILFLFVCCLIAMGIQGCIQETTPSIAVPLWLPIDSGIDTLVVLPKVSTLNKAKGTVLKDTLPAQPVRNNVIKRPAKKHFVGVTLNNKSGKITLKNETAAKTITPVNHLKEKDTIKVGDDKAGYANLETTGGTATVDADLKSDDVYKDAWIHVGFSEKLFDKYYKFKTALYKKTRLAIGTDYMFLNQFATYSASDKQAASGIFRFFGSWEAFKTKSGNSGSLIAKIENRHLIGKGLTPRNLGYETGSAMSTGTYKEIDWGLTNFYWRQRFGSHASGKSKLAFVVGIMDPGDWTDLFPFLSPMKYYINEAFINNPAMALPNQGLGFSAMYTFVPKFYVAAGIHDANGEPTNWLFNNFKSLFTQKEFFTWAEVGYNSSRLFTDGETIHLTYWHQDARTDQHIEESSGWAFSASKMFNNGITPFVRAGISKGNAAIMHHLVMAGVSMKAYKHDYLGVGLNWGGPNDRSRRDQFGFEAFYAIQLTQNLNIMPDVQLTVNPSFNYGKKIIGVFSVIRMRYAL